MEWPVGKTYKLIKNYRMKCIFFHLIHCTNICSFLLKLIKLHKSCFKWLVCLWRGIGGQRGGKHKGTSHGRSFRSSPIEALRIHCRIRLLMRGKGKNVEYWTLYRVSHLLMSGPNSGVLIFRKSQPGIKLNNNLHQFVQKFSENSMDSTAIS